MDKIKAIKTDNLIYLPNITIEQVKELKEAFFLEEIETGDPNTYIPGGWYIQEKDIEKYIHKELLETII